MSGEVPWRANDNYCHVLFIWHLYALWKTHLLLYANNFGGGRGSFFGTLESHILFADLIFSFFIPTYVE